MDTVSNNIYKVEVAKTVVFSDPVFCNIGSLPICSPRFGCLLFLLINSVDAAWLARSVVAKMHRREGWASNRCGPVYSYLALSRNQLAVT